MPKRMDIPVDMLARVLRAEEWPPIACPLHPTPYNFRVAAEADSIHLYCRDCGSLLAQRPMNDLEMAAWQSDQDRWRLMQASSLEAAEKKLRTIISAEHKARPRQKKTAQRGISAARPVRLVAASCPECGVSSPGLSEHETLCKRDLLSSLAEARAPTSASMPVCTMKFNRRGDTVINGRVLRHLGSDGLEH